MPRRSVRELLDQPVITCDDLYLGAVADAYLDPVEQRVVKLGVDWGQARDQLAGPDRDLPLSQVANFDPHQVVVASEIAETAGLDLHPYEDGDLVPISRLLDRDVSTRSGDPLGLLADVYFDDLDGAVVGYEVEEPETAMPARVIAPSADMDLGGDRLIVPDRYRFAEQAFDEDNQDEAEEQDLVFQSGMGDRRTEDPSLESSEELAEPSSLMD